jgi:hypothetical protein
MRAIRRVRSRVTQDRVVRPWGAQPTRVSGTGMSRDVVARARPPPEGRGNRLRFL